MEAIKEKLGQFYQFLKEAKTELRKVSWPSRRETLASTSVVLVLIILAALYLGLVDLGLSKVVKVILR